MSVVGSNILAGASGAGGGAAAGYTIERSLRFNSADTSYLNRTTTSAGNRKTWTWSGWLKRTKPGVQGVFFQASAPTVNSLYFNASDTLLWLVGGSSVQFQTSRVFRDTSAWMHLVMAVDTTQATQFDRIKVYVNGVKLEAAEYTTSPQTALNADYSVNAASSNHTLGGVTYGYANCYLADVHLIDGQQLEASDFGEFDADTGVWQPKAYTGTYGPLVDQSQVWSDSATRTGNQYSTGFDVEQAFDGSLTTFAATSTPNGTFTFDTSSHPLSGTIEAYCITGGLAIAMPQPFVVDGATAVNVPANTWTTISTTGSSQSISVTGPSSSYSVAALRVNGKILVDSTVSLTDNSFHLDFSDNSSTTTIGEDSSGNNNDFTANNISVAAGAGNDSLVDSPTNGTQTDTGAGGEVVGNYCTLNPLDKGGITLSNGNLNSTNAGAWSGARGTLGITSGKWYWEYTVTNRVAGQIGITTASGTIVTYAGASANAYVFDTQDGQKWSNGVSASYFGSSSINGQVHGIAFDADAGTITFYRDGTTPGVAYSSIPAGTYFPVVSQYATESGSVNFGQRPFAYTAPSGFKALNTASLPDPTIADGSTAMDAKLYSGNSSTQTISGFEFSPDLVWMKSRSGSGSGVHFLYDTVRTAGQLKGLQTNNTNAEGTALDNSTYGYLSSFTSDGFSLDAGSSPLYMNFNGTAYVSWAWDGGTSTVTNTDGSITSNVRANASAGFSIVTYSGSSTVSTVGHGLGAAPSMMIVKSRTQAYNWTVYHRSLTSANFVLLLNSTGAQVSSVNQFNNTAPTSSVFTVGTGGNTNTNGADFVAYCFAPVDQYSSFGSFEGNGNANGPFVFTGFTPKLIMTKDIDTASNWNVWDTSRSTYNLADERLSWNSSAAEDNAADIDILSNGFKIRDTSTDVNENTRTFIYCAWAENPFKTARAR